MTDNKEPDTERAAQLTDRARKQTSDHEGNRASADPDAPQPTRDQQK
jgi:hypothetical protein